MDKKKKRWLNIAVVLLITLFFTTWGPTYAPNVFGDQEPILWFMAVGLIGYDLYFIWRERRANQE